MQINKVYYRDGHGHTLVRRILDIKNDIISYERLHGPDSLMRKGKFGSCKIKNFKDWVDGETEELEDYSALNGCKILETFLVLNSSGKPIFRCSFKKGVSYLEKNHAFEIDENTIQLTNDIIENKIKEFCGDIENNPFFLAVKNDHCVVCNRASSLINLHIISKKYKKLLSNEIKKYLSNVLIICTNCHKLYNGLEELDKNFNNELDFIKALEHHFLDNMKPKFLPEGWKLCWKL